MCLKYKTVNINYLFTELLLYKINATFAIVLVLGHVMLLTCIICYIQYLYFFSTAVCLFLFVSLCVLLRLIV